MNALKKYRLRGTIPTQRAAAKLLGVSETCISKWESGVNKPRAQMIPTIAKLYGCTVDDLLGNDANNTGD